MQRVTFENPRGPRLVGHLHKSNGPTAVVMAHGFTGDKSMGGRFDRIAEALHDDGHAVLAFDFAGCGESDDDRITVERHVDDLRSAVAFVRAQGHDRIGLYGQSLGGRVCLQAFEPGIAAMALVGAGTGPMTYEWRTLYSPEQMAELEEKGYLTDREVDQRWREAVQVDRQMLRDVEEVDQEALLSRVTCPVLLIHGDADEEERALMALALAGMRYLPEDSRLEVIEGATHRFEEHLDRVVDLARGWFGRHL